MPKRKTEGKNMMPTKKHTIARGRRAIKRTAAKKKPVEISRSHEEMVVKRLALAPSKAPDRSLQIQDLIYNSAAELRSLALRSGFNLGADAYRNSSGSIAALEHLLENGGLGKMVYYPFESSSAFTSHGVKTHGIKLGTNVHAFEAGVISGYLSAHAKQQVAVRETECVFNGSNYCKFIASARNFASDEPNKAIDFIPGLITALHEAVMKAEKPRGSNNYYLFAVRPLLSEPVFSEASKLLYLAGKLLAKSRLPGFEQSVALLSSFLRIDGAKVSRDRKGRTVLNLTYGRESSSGRFVDLTTALISGLVKGAYGRNVQVSRSLRSSGAYNVRMEVLGEVKRGVA